jgi:hypothetical protein
MLSQFCLRLACGLALALIVTSPAQVTSGFFRIQMLVTLGLSVLAALSLPAAAPNGSLVTVLAIVAAVASFVGSFGWLLERRRLGQTAVAVVALASAPAAVLSHSAVFVGSWPARVLGGLDPLAGAFVLGSTVTAMLLGHWYLVTPTMALAPLRRLVALMGASLALRTLLAGVGLLLLVYGPESAQAAAPVGEALWVWSTLRWLAGIIGGGVVAALAWNTVAIRSTQSATGILYVGVILVFLGELAAQVLSHRVGLPL